MMKSRAFVPISLGICLVTLAGFSCWSAPQAHAAAQIEAVARGEGMEHHVADHQRPMGRDLPGVRLGRRTIDDGHAATADHLEHPVGSDVAGRVLVDADAQQARVLGDDAEQATEAVPLLEVLVDDDPRKQAEARRDLRHAVLGRGARGAEGDHVTGDDRGAGGRALIARFRCKVPCNWAQISASSAIDFFLSFMVPFTRLP